jgi:hypothetical protein
MFIDAPVSDGRVDQIGRVTAASLNGRIKKLLEPGQMSQRSL